jgi:7,8-dihydropterin-6-yl-methyl-4-(beta-D-ribofuranosyl)aminobenzene 5'-phosphate synthase
MLKAKELEIVTVSENTSTRRGLLGEWGLSILVKTPDLHLLMDAGASEAISRNLDSLDIDLDRVEAIIISHGHGDHTGGLRTLLLKMRKEQMRIIAHPDIWSRKCVKKKDSEKYNYVGIPFNRDELESLGGRFELASEPVWITEDIVTSGEEPMVTDFEALPDTLFQRKGEEYVPDTLADDQSLFLKTELGLVVLLGCAHRGIVNIIRHARKLTGMEKVYMVIGGTHMGFASEEQIGRTVESLKEIGVERLGVSHCTGPKVGARLAHEFGERFFTNNTGTVIEFPFSP